LAKLSEKKIAVIIIAFFGVALAAIASVSVLRWGENSKIKDQIAQVDKEIDKLTERVDSIPSLEAKKRAAIEALDDMTKILPDKGDLQHDAFLRLLQVMATESRVEVKNLNVEPEKETPDKKFARFRYKVLVEGTYPQFVNFLHMIETHKRFLKIDSFRIGNKQIGANCWPESNKKEIDLTISTYTYSAAPE
jgi:Tfp pilus assembly protein PilO